MSGLDTGLALAAHGIPTYPTRDKAPIVSDPRADGSTEAADLVRMWGGREALLPGFYPGLASLLVVDVDEKGGVSGHASLDGADEWWAQLPAEPDELLAVRDLDLVEHWEPAYTLLADLPGLRAPEIGEPDAILEHLTGNGIDYTTWAEWERLDAHEMALGAQQGRERVKVVPRADMVSAGRQ